MNNFITIENEAENSFSFAFGDELRRGILSPWLFPLLPINIPRRLLMLRKERRCVSDTQNIDCLFVFDLEKMRTKDQKAFVEDALNYTDNIITLGIGKPSIGVVFDHQISSRSERNVEPREWNTSVEKIILGIIRAYRPQKMVFVGKYPYAGIISAMRRCNSRENMHWISVRGDKNTINERSDRFSKVKDLTYFVEHDEIVRNTIYFDDESTEMKRLLASTAQENGINMIKTIEHAEFLFVSNSETDIMKHLLKNQTIIYSSTSRVGLGIEIPSYVVNNLICIEKGHELSTFKRMILYRKGKNNRSNAVMSVQAKLDVWFNS